MFDLPPPGTVHPAPLLVRKFSDGTVTKSFFPYSHTADDVAIAVQYYASQPPNTLTNDQHQAMRTYFEMRNRGTQNTEDLVLLRQYLNVFDRLFFFGALGNHC